MVNKINHIGVAVKDLEKSIDFCCNILELEKAKVIETPEMKVAMIKIGEVTFELMQSISESSAIAKFINKRGEGVQHVCLEVDDIRNEVTRMKTMGYEFANEQPTRGIEGDIVFLKPKNTLGILFELVQV